MLLGLQTWAGFIEFLKHQDNFSWVDITLLERFDCLSKIQLLRKIDPTCIDIELLDFVLEVSALVCLLQENNVCFLDSAGGK